MNMIEEKKQNRTKNTIIQCAKKEFLEKGYKGANLRDICKAAGVTTGAFYFSFAGKEALLQAILQPILEEAEKKMSIYLEKEIENPNTSAENDKEIMKFEWTHKEEILIFMEKAQGSCYEKIKYQVYDTVFQAFENYFQKNLNGKADKALIKILVDMRIQSNLSILKGNFDMEYSVNLTEAIGIHAEGGTEKLIEYIKKNAHR